MHPADKPQNQRCWVKDTKLEYALYVSIIYVQTGKTEQYIVQEYVHSWYYKEKEGNYYHGFVVSSGEGKGVQRGFLLMSTPKGKSWEKIMNIVPHIDSL